MSFIRYDRRGTIVEIRIIENGSPVQKFKADSHNYPKIIKMIEDKYGFKPIIDLKDSINSIPKDVKPKEPNWLDLSYGKK